MYITSYKMKKCAIPKLIEKQKSLFCGKHAINNLLQQKIADCNKLKAVSKSNLPGAAARCTRRSHHTAGSAVRQEGLLQLFQPPLRFAPGRERVARRSQDCGVRGRGRVRLGQSHHLMCHLPSTGARFLGNSERGGA